MTSADLKFIPQSKAFAVDGEKNPSIPDTSTTAMNLATGFPSVYSKPLADGGKLIQRKEMNTLFYQLMLFQNFLQNGGYITWNNDVMMGIGGYPNGAVLSLIDSTTGAETRVQSCVDNNYLQPTSESIGEKYKVNTSTVPHTYTKDASGDVIWRYNSTHTAFRSWGENEEYYRIYSDGWCEQGGVVYGASGSAENIKVALHVTMRDNRYNVVVSPTDMQYGRDNPSGRVAAAESGWGNRTTTEFYCGFNSGFSTPQTMSWRVCGFASI